MKKLLWIIAAIVVVGGSYGLYQFNKPHRDIQGEKAKIQISADDLLSAYTGDESSANAEYGDKVVAVSGKVIEVEATHIKLEPGILCNGDFSATKLQSGESATLKGRVLTYDELFEEVTLDNSIVQD